VFDLRRERAQESPIRQARKDSILLFDGIFLLRPELRGCWDFRIFIEVEFEVVIERVKSRDQKLFGTPEQVRQRYTQRYIPAQRTYLQSCQPK
jgi:uridine kinase